jgi:SAM-dependent methyltransferase
MKLADSAESTSRVDDSRTITDCAACGSVGVLEPALWKDGYEILRCRSCGVGRANVLAFKAEALYTNEYFTGKVSHAYVDYAGSENILRREFRRQLRFLRDFTPGGKLLEIGCAYGFFLQEAKLFFDVYGIEISKGAVDFFRRAGLSHVWRAPLTENLARNIGELDAVVLLDVIEHVDDVIGTMALAISRLRPGGVVLLTTGDWNSFVARTTGASWRLMAPPHHLWYFTRTSLRRLFERLGCREEHYSHPWKLVPLELIMNQLGTMLGHSMALPKPLHRMALPANLFDAMRVVYRKEAIPDGRPKID